MLKVTSQCPNPCPYRTEQAWDGVSSCTLVSGVTPQGAIRRVTVQRLHLDCASISPRVLSQQCMYQQGVRSGRDAHKDRAYSSPTGRLCTEGNPTSYSGCKYVAKRKSKTKVLPFFNIFQNIYYGAFSPTMKKKLSLKF